MGACGPAGRSSGLRGVEPNAVHRPRAGRGGQPILAHAQRALSSVRRDRHIATVGRSQFVVAHRLLASAQHMVEREAHSAADLHRSRQLRA